MDDFSTPEEIIAKRLAGEINQTACDQELNLLYVSATRAKTHLYIADPLYASLENEGVVPRRPEPVAPPPPVRNLELAHGAQISRGRGASSRSASPTEERAIIKSGADESDLSLSAYLKRLGLGYHPSPVSMWRTSLSSAGTSRIWGGWAAS